MSGGASGGSQNVTTTSAPPAWLQPYLQNYMAQGSKVAGQPYKPYTGQTVAGLNSTQYGAMDAIAKRATQGTPEQSAGRRELTGTLGGGYLGHQSAVNPYASDANPYLQKNIDAAQGDVMRNFNTIAAPSYGTANARSGSFGNAGLAMVENEGRRGVADELGRISSGMRMADYNRRGDLTESAVNRNEGAYQSERNRMQGALGMVPGFANMDYQDAQALMGVGDRLQGQTQAGLDDQFDRFNEARNYPQQQLDVLSRLFGNQSTGQTTNQQLPKQPGTNKAAGAIGGGLAGAQMGSMIMPGMGTAVGGGLGALMGLLSDRRAKTDIRRVGTMNSGLPVYTYRYRGGEVTHMGVMADEAQQVAPHAVHTGPDGLQRVNYAALGD